MLVQDSKLDITIFACDSSDSSLVEQMHCSNVQLRSRALQETTQPNAIKNVKVCTALYVYVTL